jgi:hypothetical protein
MPTNGGKCYQNDVYTFPFIRKQQMKVVIQSGFLIKAAVSAANELTSHLTSIIFSSCKARKVGIKKKFLNYLRSGYAALHDE